LTTYIKRNAGRKKFKLIKCHGSVYSDGTVAGSPDRKRAFKAGHLIKRATRLYFRI
jgi:hypothetical protein